MDCCLRENDEVVAVFPAVLCGLGGWYRDWRSFAGRWCLDSRLRGNDEVGGGNDEVGWWPAGGGLPCPAQGAHKGHPYGGFGEWWDASGHYWAGRPAAGDKPQPYIFRWVSWRMPAMRRAVSARCWTSSGLRGRRRMVRSR